MVALHIAVLLYDHDWQASLDVPRLKLALQTKCSFDVRGAGGPRAKPLLVVSADLVTVWSAGSQHGFGSTRMC